MANPEESSTASKAPEGQTAFIQARVNRYKGLKKWVKEQGLWLRSKCNDMSRGVNLINLSQVAPWDRSELLDIVEEKLEEQELSNKNLVGQEVGIKTEPPLAMSFQHQPPLMMRISKARWVKLELENEILRRHAANMGRDLLDRLNHEIGIIAHRAMAGAPLNKFQRKTKAMPKGSLIVVLKANAQRLKKIAAEEPTGRLWKNAQAKKRANEELAELARGDSGDAPQERHRTKRVRFAEP